MNENPQLNLVKVPEAQPPTAEMRVVGPRDLSPVSWTSTVNPADDFRPVAIESSEITVEPGTDPKGSSAVGSADFSMMQEDLIPEPEPTNPSPSLSDAPVPTVNVAKGPTLPPPPEL